MESRRTLQGLKEVVSVILRRYGGEMRRRRQSDEIDAATGVRGGAKRRKRKRGRLCCEGAKTRLG